MKSSTAGAIDRLQETGSALACRRQVAIVLQWMVLGLFIGLAFLVLMRRLGGAFNQPLGGTALVAVALCIAAAVFCFRQLSEVARHDPAEDNPRGWIFRYLLPTVGAIALLVALSIPGSSILGLLCAWSIVIGADVGQWLDFLGPQLRRDSAASPPRHPAVEPLVDSSELEFDEEEPEVPAGLVQQITRVVEGPSESIHALVRASVAPQDRLAIMHLAFCPPLHARPELTAHALDAADADVKITQAETFGVRLEVRLAATAESPRELLVEIIGAAKEQSE